MTCMNMYVMRMHDNDLEVEHDSYSGEGWISRCWVALYDMPDDEWECIRMAENDRERLTSKENGLGGGHSMRICTLYDMHETEWEFLRLSHNWWTCMWWDGMIMHANVWYWLIFKGCVGRLRLSRILRHAWWMYQNDWEWLRMSHIHGGVWVIPCWFTLYDMHENELGMHQAIS